MASLADIDTGLWKSIVVYYGVLVHYTILYYTVTVYDTGYTIYSDSITDENIVRSIAQVSTAVQCSGQ